MRIKLSIQIIGETKRLEVDRVVAVDELLYTHHPTLILRNHIEQAVAHFFAKDEDNITEQVMEFLHEEREIADLRKAKEEADAKLAAALKRRTGA